MTPTKCPYCGSDDITCHRIVYPPFACNGCGRLFSEHDAHIEDIRHEMSRILFAHNATHDNPLQLNVSLSESPDTLTVTGAYEQEDIIWFTFSDFEQDDEFDNFDEEYLQKILEAMQNA